MKYLYLISIIFIAIFLTPYIFRVNNVYCINQFGICSQEIMSELSGFENLSYKKLNNKLDNYLKKNNKIEEYNFVFIPPSTLRINIIEKRGIVALKYENNNKFIIISEDLVEILQTDTTLLPIIYVESNSAENNISEFVVDIMFELNRYYGIEEAILAESLKIVYDGSTEIIFPIEGDVDVLLGSLEVILFRLNQALENSKIETRAQDITTIDLRFSNPIIK